MLFHLFREAPKCKIFIILHKYLNNIKSNQRQRALTSATKACLHWHTLCDSGENYPGKCSLNLKYPILPLYFILQYAATCTIALVKKHF